MDWVFRLDMQLFLLFSLVFVRISGLLVTAPMLGLKELPARVKALLAAALALVITPTQVDVSVEVPGTLVHYLVLVWGELVVGLSLGLGLAVLFSGIHLAGQLMGRISGLMLADVFDPASGESVPQFSRLLFLVGMAVFVTIGGHRVLMAGLLDTFYTIRPGTALAYPSLGGAFVELLDQSFRLGVRAAAPVVTALLLSTLVMGLISRTLPQLNILAVGFGMNSLLVFAVLALTLGGAAWVFQDQIEAALAVILDGLNAPFPGHWLG
ncbi:MAG TPA: type III secretion protein [Planctomycetes bacterium]|nr:type III secretion protein [Planctomycetota bacterium]